MRSYRVMSAKETVAKRLEISCSQLQLVCKFKWNTSAKKVKLTSWKTPKIGAEMINKICRQLVSLRHLDRRFHVRKKRRIFRRNLFPEPVQSATF